MGFVGRRRVHIGLDRRPSRRGMALFAPLRRDEVGGSLACGEPGLVTLRAIGRHSAMGKGRGQPCRRLVAGVAIIGTGTDA